jgi:hypothetical protein
MNGLENGGHGSGATTQTVRVESGFAYGVVGADLHVFQDRGPIYLLTEFRSPHPPDNNWLIAQPSRLLNAHWQVVEFTGRERELADLSAWRDRASSRFAARWLYAPGGQGKSRLAAKLAGESQSAGWKVINILHGTAARPSGSHDMRLGDAHGVLLIVDYAERWPVSHLNWLFSNSIFHQHIPTRLLLVSRTPQPWSAIRAVLTDLSADTSTDLLRDLPGQAGPDGRDRMFCIARDCFAKLYGLPDPAVIPVPRTLSDPNFGLTLALHMAALVAVDAHVNSVKAPDELAGLSAYLLDRERKHWTQLYENRLEGADFKTPPRLIGRSAFTAILTGPVPYSIGLTIMRRLEVDHPSQVLSDHAICYPSADPEAVLEPLYPDRLAEDFLALAIPGHAVAAYPAAPWAAPTLQALMADEPLALPLNYITRTITFLANAASRWPHVTSRLEAILRANPTLALIAGNAAMTGIAALDDIDPELLEAISDRFPDRDFDLDLGIAALAGRVAQYHISKTEDAAARARIHGNLAHRLANAGLHDEALHETEQAAAIWRRLSADDSSYEANLASSLTNLGNRLHPLGRGDEAVLALEEAVAIRRRLASRTFQDQSSLASSLRVLGSSLSAAGRKSEALTVTQESVTILRRLATDDAESYADSLAVSLHNLGNRLSELGRAREALAATQQSSIILRRLTDEDEGVHAPNLAKSLYNLGKDLQEAGRIDDSIAATKQAISIYRRLARSNPTEYELLLAWALLNLAKCLRGTDMVNDALAATQDAAVAWRQLAEADPASYEVQFSGTLMELSGLLAMSGRWNEAAAASEESVNIRRRLLQTGSTIGGIALAKALINYGTDLAATGQSDEAVASAEEAMTIFRDAAARNPEGFRAELGAALHNFSVILSQSDRLQDAVNVAAECVALYQQLSIENPNKYRADLEMIFEVMQRLRSKLSQDPESPGPR